MGYEWSHDLIYAPRVQFYWNNFCTFETTKKILLNLETKVMLLVLYWLPGYTANPPEYLLNVLEIFREYFKKYLKMFYKCLETNVG